MNLIWNKPIPSNWNPASLVAQWAAISPNMTLPAGQVYVAPPSLETWNTPEIMQKGVTHWVDNWVQDEVGGVEGFRADPAYAKKEYNDVPRIRDIFGLGYYPPENWDNGYNSAWWPTGPYDETQARAKGQSVSITPRLWIGETEEGEDYIHEGHPMWKWFYQELKARYDAQKAVDGVPYFLAHNYFTRYGHNLYDLTHSEYNASQREALYSSPPSNNSVWLPGLYTPGGNLSDTNTIVQAIYLNGPKNLAKQIFTALFGMDVSRMMGYYTGLFAFNRMEWLPGFASSFRFEAGPGAHSYQSVPAGLFERSDKAPLDPNILISLPFLAREFGNIYVSWGSKVKPSANPRAIYYNYDVHPGKDRWYPDSANGGVEAYPGYISPGSENGDKQNEQEAYLNDLVHFGNKQWNDVAGPVAGGTVAYCDFRLDGGTWISKTANGSDVVRAWDEKRGFVRTRYKNNKLMLFYTNPFADNQQHLLEIRSPFNPNTIYTATVCGNGVHPTCITV